MRGTNVTYDFTVGNLGQEKEKDIVKVHNEFWLNVF